MKRFLVAAGLLMAACGEPLAPAPEGLSDNHQASPVARVTITPDTLRLAVGETKSATCVTRKANGAIIRRTCNWKSLNTAVATTTGARVETAPVTGRAPGTTHIQASAGGHRDRAVVIVSGAAPPPPDTTTPPPDTTTPPPPPPDTTTPPPPVPAGCPTSGYLRLVSVSTVTQRNNAIQNAQPGDLILLAPGTYAGAFPTVTRSGTASDPIVICGPRTAVMDLNRASNVRLQANYWVFQGFRITDFPSIGFHIGADAATANNHHNVIRRMEIDHALQELFAINGAGHHNVIEDSDFHHSGEGSTNWEEGVYIGEALNEATAPLACDNVLRGNRFDNIGTESIDLKTGACRTLVENNVIDGRGTRRIDGNAVSLISVASDSNIIRGNILSYGSPHGIVFWHTSAAISKGSVVTGNVIHLYNLHGVTGQAGIRVFSPGATLSSCTGNVVDNIPAGGSAYSGWTCTP